MKQHIVKKKKKRYKKLMTLRKVINIYIYQMNKVHRMKKFPKILKKYTTQKIYLFLLKID